MFRTTDLRYLADAARADHVFGEEGANQGALTFFAAVTRNRPEVLEELLNSHRQTALVVVDAYARVSLASNHAFFRLSLEIDQRCWSIWLTITSRLRSSWWMLCGLVRAADPILSRGLSIISDRANVLECLMFCYKQNAFSLVNAHPQVSPDSKGETLIKSEKSLIKDFTPYVYVYFNTRIGVLEHLQADAVDHSARLC
jgi:hypothetical protein